MRPSRQITLTTLGLVLTAAAFAGAEPASAGTYSVHFCDAEAGYLPPAGPEWSQAVTGGSYNSTQPGTTLDCSAPLTPTTQLIGAGGWVAGAVIPGTTAVASFTPPAGTTIAALSGQRQAFVGPGSYSEASVFTSANRALDDTSAQRSGGALYDPAGSVAFDAVALGGDGAAGVSWGGRCPASLPPGHSQCGGASYGLSGAITLFDQTAPTGSITATVSAATATVAWNVGDPQSGISDAQVTRDGASADSRSGTCDARLAHQCTLQLSGTLNSPIAEGQTVSFTLTAYNAANDQLTKTVSVSRPAAPKPPASTTAPAPTATPPSSPAATPPPSVPSTPAGSSGSPTTTPSVTLAARRAGRSLVLSGTARGCARVALSLPSKRRIIVPVRKGTWKTTVARRAGNYIAACGSAKASHRAR